MDIEFFIIFILITIPLTILNPFWGCVAYLANIFFRFQEYVPELAGVPLARYLLYYTFSVALFKGQFRLQDFGGKLIFLSLFVLYATGIPFLMGVYNLKNEEIIGKFLFVILIVMTVRDTDQVRLFFYSLFFILFFLSAILFHSYYFGNNYYFYWSHERPFGSGFIENPNSIVMWTNFGYVLSAFLLIYNTKFRWRILFLISLFLSTFGIVICMSRSGVLQFLTATLFLLSFIGTKKQKIAAAMVILLIGGFVASKAGSRFWYRMSMISGQQENGEYEGSAAERLRSWQSGWEIFKNHPLTGVGAYNIKNYNFRRNQDGSLEGRSLHEGFIEMMAELGIIGMFLFLSVIFWSIIDLLRIQRPKGEKGDFLFVSSRAMLCCCSIWAICNLFGSVQNSPFLYILFGYSTALISVRYNENRKPQLPPPEGKAAGQHVDLPPKKWTQS